MTKLCKGCGQLFNNPAGSDRRAARRRYCSPRCKKNFENSLRPTVQREPQDAGGLACSSDATLANLRFLHGELLAIGRQVDTARRSIESLLGARGPAQGGLFVEVTHE